MDCDDFDFLEQINAEGEWDEVQQSSAFEVPPEMDHDAGGDTELDPPTDAELAPPTDVEDQPPDLPIHVDPPARAVVAVESVTTANVNSAVTPARTREVLLPSTTPVSAQVIGDRRPHRCRLVGKQRVPQAKFSQFSAKYRLGLNWDKLSHAAFSQLNPRTQFSKVFNKCRWWLNVLPFTESSSSLQQDEPQQVKLLRRARKDFKQLGARDKHDVLRLFLSDTQAPMHIAEFVQARWPVPASVDTKESGYFLYARSVLLTWNGDWGLFPEVTGIADGDWRAVVPFLEKDERFIVLWADFKSFCERLSDAIGAAHHAFSLEVCVDTLRDGVVRIHSHLYLSSDTGKMKLARAQFATFKNSKPHKSHKVAALNNRACSGFAGCYYILAPKIGVIWNHSNVCAYKDFGVSPEWISNMVQAEKMEFRDAIQEMTRCGKGYQRRVAELKAWQAGKNELILQARVDAERAYHAAHNKKFHSFPRIDAWLARNTQPHMRRKQILVLEGASGLGKTEYIKALVGHDFCLELNADGMVKPVLLGFDAMVHRLIFWDECSARLVLENRKLFQCPPTWIALGFSPTGKDVYNVWVNDAVMAIGSNSWTEQVNALKRRSDEAWLRANTVHVTVSEPM